MLDCLDGSLLDDWEWELLSLIYPVYLYSGPFLLILQLVVLNILQLDSNFYY